MKRNSLKIFYIIFLFILPFALFGQNEFTDDENNDGKPDEWYTMEDGIIRRIESDRNYDGEVDSITVYSKDGQKEYEELDFNYDGNMDDFYYYFEGVLIKHEIDSNYDSLIDIWFEIEGGRFVKLMQRDVDFDGEIDIRNEY